VPPLPNNNNNNNRPRTLTGDLLTPLALKKSASGDGVIGFSKGGGSGGEPPAGAGYNGQSTWFPRTSRVAHVTEYQFGCGRHEQQQQQ
jgi:hypothetical protein